MRHTALVLLVVAVVAAQEGRPGDAPDTSFAGARFHFLTGFSDGGVNSDEVRFGDSLPLYKSYPGSDTVHLAPARPLARDLGSTLLLRHSVRRFTSGPLKFADLSTLLLRACGITGRRGEIDHRAAPSAGALYPIDVYVMAADVENLASGLYHFHPRDSLLERIRPGDLAGDLFRVAHEQAAAAACPAALLIAARFDRATHKYGDRGYRYTYMEAGAICQNVYLAATALDLGTVALGAFNDEAANRLVGLDGVAEAVLILMPLGQPATP